MKRTLTVDYATLKTSTIKVLEFTKDYIYEEKVHLRTSIAEDLSLWELDGYNYLDNYKKKFNIALPDKAYEYVCPAVLKMGFFEKALYIPFHFLALPFMMLIYPILLLYPDRQEKIKNKIRRNKNRLTLGDLAATLAIGEFVKREDIKIELK